MGSTTGAVVHKQLDEEDTMSTAVVEALADAAGVSRTELPPLFESIDPDALERVYETTGTESYIRFHHAGFDIGVDGNGVVTVQKDGGMTLHSSD
jgi:hypothetical protein